MITSELDKMSAEIVRRLNVAEAEIRAGKERLTKRDNVVITYLHCARDLAGALPGAIHYHCATGQEDTPCACGNPGTYAYIAPEGN
jgi:hypothetical protein